MFIKMHLSRSERTIYGTEINTADCAAAWQEIPCKTRRIPRSASTKALILVRWIHSFLRIEKSVVIQAPISWRLRRDAVFLSQLKVVCEVHFFVFPHHNNTPCCSTLIFLDQGVFFLVYVPTFSFQRVQELCSYVENIYQKQQRQAVIGHDGDKVVDGS